MTGGAAKLPITPVRRLMRHEDLRRPFVLPRVTNPGSFPVWFKSTVFRPATVDVLVAIETVQR
jgi:hypothetical protein